MKKTHKAAAVLGIAASMSAGMGLHAPEPAPYDDNPRRSKGARTFKRKKQHRKTADKSKRMNRRKSR